MKKKIFRFVIRPFFLLLASFFYEKKYLTGRYFDYSLVGWKWCLMSLFSQKILGYNRKARWPVSRYIAIDEPANIIFDPNDMNNFRHFGCYYSNAAGGKIIIGAGTWIAPNVGIVTTNHNKAKLSVHDTPKDVVIGSRCWIGMNSVILPGVFLADGIIVGAGSVVTKSFNEKNTVIAGNPAKIISKY